MAKEKNIIAIFKRNSLFSELKRLLKKEGFEISLKKNLKSPLNLNPQNLLLIFEIMSENELKNIFPLFKKELAAPYCIFILKRNVKFSEKSFNFKALFQPIMFNELLTHIKTFNKQKFNIRFGNKLYDHLNSKLINNINGDFIKLTYLENKLIYFILNRKDGCTKNQILKNVWEHTTKLETHTMESLIYRLRKKIEDDPNQPRTLVQINKKYYLKSD